MSNKNFYRAFEEKFRGSREDIKNRVAVYLPLVLPLKKIYPETMALDIGCGRGEWLELLNEHDFKIEGIDLDQGMLSDIKALGLNAKLGNGIHYLQSKANESLSLITAFHVVEHITFEDLQLLVEEALRVLKPGGILILETPNPENIKVATEYFYLDPTHQKPIPSSLLSFLPEFYGYKRTKVLKLQESKKLLGKKNITLQNVLEGASPDYAVIAQKTANRDILKQFDTFFSKEFGLTLNMLTEKFETRLHRLETKLQQMETLAKTTQYKYKAIVDSKTWKMTKPVRTFMDWAKYIFKK